MNGVETMEPEAYTCPRCSQPAVARFYGPCESCRDELRASLGNEGHELEQVVYETKMNVVPNHVATKD